MFADLSLSELRRYTPDVAEPADFDEFWSGQLAAARAAARAPVFTPAGTAMRFEPGQSREARLVAYAGERRVVGFNGRINGKL